MVELVRKGIGRQEGHELLRQASIEAREKNIFMKDILYANNKIKNNFTKEELEEIFDPHKYIGKAIQQIEILVEFLKDKYKL